VGAGHDSDRHPIVLWAETELAFVLFIWGLTIAGLMWWLVVTPDFSMRVAIYSLTTFGCIVR
jgi:hypothetical protein